MSDIEHAELVATLVKDGQLVIDELTPEKADLWHMASAVCGEAGELFDAVKKHVIYNKELDHENIVEELGDLEFYLERIRQIVNVSREETVDHNIKKLSTRYDMKKGYTNEAAQQRADKV